MKRFTALLAALFAGAVVIAAEAPYGTIPLDGGRIEPVSMEMVESSNEHLNFCFAAGFPDGTVYLNHSVGIHTVTEHSCRDFSSDNGRTWQKMPLDFSGFNTYLSQDGKKCAVSCWDDKVADRHEITRRAVSADGKSVATEKSSIQLPFRSTFRLHREVLRTRDGRLLLPGYGRKDGSSKLFAFLIESKDDGKTWNYLSTIQEDAQSKMPEGPNEGAVVELKNGDLLAFIRVGGGSPLQQLRSGDGGKTWSAPEEIAPFCVAPSAKLLSNGALAIITGRPRLYLLIDFTGTGRNYQRVVLYGGSGSSYASIVETKPNRLLVIYDESDFGPWRNPGLFSRIMAMTVDVVRDDKMKRSAVNDPEASNYVTYYSAVGEQTPDARRNFLPSAFRKKGEAGSESWYEIRKIAERPYPVLHLENRGTTDPQKFSHFLGAVPPGTERLAVGFEMRLEDAAENRPQFAVRFSLEGKDPDSPNLFGWIGFGVKELSCRTDGKIVKVPCELGTAFHAFTLDADTKSGSYRLFRKGEKTPLFTGKLTPSRDIPLGITWGDGATDVFGAVDLSYIGWNDR